MMEKVKTGKVKETAKKPKYAIIDREITMNKLGVIDYEKILK